MSRSLVLRRLLVASAAPFALLASAAHAQQAPSANPAPAPVPSAQNSTQLQEVVVTAARQTQNLQKVSTAVTVIGGEAIKAQAITNFGQLFSDTPSIQATAQPGGFSVDVRGLGGDLPAGSTQGSVALVSDGVYNINSQSTTVGLFDVNRVEVLAGPQSTRFGPNADGGIVNVLTNDPQLSHFGGTALITGGNYGLVRGEFALNMPINDQLAFRISGAVVSRGSYFTPAEGDNKAQSVRMKLLYKPNDKLTLKLTYQMDHIGGAGDGSNTFPVYTNKVPVYSGGGINQLSNPWGQSPSDPVNVNSANLFQHTLIANATYDVASWAVLDVLGSYSTITGAETGTIYLPPWSTSQTEGPVITGADIHEFAPFDQYTGEIRLHNAPGSKIQWNVGYYHWNYLETYSLTNASFLDTPPIKTTTATNAIYGEVTYPVTDRFRVIGGLRESFDHRTFDFNNAGIVTPTFVDNFSHFDYRAGVEYDVTPSSMLYFTTSTAYRPGGLSSFNPVTNAPNSFESEVNRAYEFGSKNRFFGNRVQVNADVFYYDQSNYQNLDKYTGFIPAEGGAPCASGDTRAGCLTPTFGVQAHTLGYEAQINANITRDDVLTFSGTYLHAVFADKQGTCATVDAPTTTGCLDGYNSQTAGDPGLPFFFNISGAVQPHSPKYAATVSYRHIFRLPSGATLSAGGDAFHTTGYWVNPVEDADRYGYQPGYWMGNASVTFTPAHADWTVTGWVRNVSDYAVKQSVLPATSIGDPRTFGGTLAYKF